MKTKKLVSLGLGAAMALSVALPTFASDGEVNVQGTISLSDPTVGPDGTYDVTMPSLVTWSITDASNREVVGADNTITNNSTVDIGVTFENFEQMNQDAIDIEDALDLYLSGGLAVGDLNGKNLSKGFDRVANPISIDTLSQGDSLQFGFTGKYKGLITNSTNYAPEYKMTLGFELKQQP